MIACQGATRREFGIFPAPGRVRVRENLWFFTTFTKKLRGRMSKYVHIALLPA